MSKFYNWIDTPTSANCQDDVTFASDTERTDGFTAGRPASALRVNTALRQANLVAKALMDALGDTTCDVMSSASDVASVITGHLPIDVPFEKGDGNYSGKMKAEGGTLYSANSVTGNYSFAFGYGNDISGNNSMALAGWGHILANAGSAVISGHHCKIYGNYSALGGERNTIRGKSQFVFGDDNETANQSADDVALFGNHLYVGANGQTGFFACGRYNDFDTNDLFEIGYGTGSSNLKNIFAVDKDGKVTATSFDGATSITTATMGNVTKTSGIATTEMRTTDILASEGKTYQITLCGYNNKRFPLGILDCRDPLIQFSKSPVDFALPPIYAVNSWHTPVILAVTFANQYTKFQLLEFDISTSTSTALDVWSSFQIYAKEIK